MNSAMANEIIGTLLELSIFFYIFYKLLDLDKKDLRQYLLIYIGMTTLVIVSNHYFLGYGAFIYIFAFIFVLKWFTQESLFKVLFVFVSSMIALLCVEIVLIPLLGMITTAEVVVTIISLAIANILMVVLIQLFEAPLKSYIQKYENRYINYIAINIFLYAFIYKILWDHDESLVRENMLYFGIAMFLLLVVNYFVYREVATISERNKALEVQEQMRETLEQMILEIRSKQHEYKNNLTTIIGILETNPADEACLKIENFLNDVYVYDGFESDLLQIDRDIVKAVLFMKRSEAREKGIHFTYDCQVSLTALSVLDYEISLVLNNLINNAFEAVQFDDEPWVRLEIGFDAKEKAFYFQTKNAGHSVEPAHLLKLSDKNFTTKSAEKKTRGFGLWTIKNIAKKHNGHLELYFENDDIVIKVLFS
ncbi:sensor histidine kinase [Fusibacter ferrireducens]|uniref:GHKL domain-containing protein n=1 Tax=Fusibacter ferrireducens TaxID=2785058 RepID=A0ABR9ZZT1_9FIRM|nr:GHKL domain-containing protein [Fusibacter ferrireducens]MBF4695871.1 GHKL domain-containing protein [Fusibacter ferrireducens]